MHYYQFNIGDYVSSTAHLEPLEDIAFRRMLDLYYSSESPLPNDVEFIARKIRMRSHCECIADVLQEFFELDADEEYWHCTRADNEIAAFNEKANKASEAAKKRWGNKKPAKTSERSTGVMRTQCERNADAMPTHTERNANHKPLTINQEPITNSKKESTKEKPCVADRSTALTGDAPLDESKNTSPDKPTKTKRFVKPSLEELTEYFRERGITQDAEAAKFHDYYESNGWRVGKNPMKDWRSAVRNWIRQSGNFSRSGPAGQVKETAEETVERWRQEAKATQHRIDAMFDEV